MNTDKMLGKKCPRGCPFGRDCCTLSRGKAGKAARRSTKRSERQAVRKFLSNM